MFECAATQRNASVINTSCAFPYVYRGFNRTDCVCVNGVEACKVRDRHTCLLMSCGVFAYPMLVLSRQDCMSSLLNRLCAPAAAWVCDGQSVLTDTVTSGLSVFITQWVTCVATGMCCLVSSSQISDGTWQECQSSVRTLLPTPPPDTVARYTTRGECM